MQILPKKKWNQRETKSADGDEEENNSRMVQSQAFLGAKDLLSRWLVGKFEADDVPTRNYIRRWAQQTWKGDQGVQVNDMNRVPFLFEFQSIKKVEHVLMGD